METAHDTKTLLEEIKNLIAVNQSLADSEHRFRTVADNAPVMIWMSDTNMLCSYFNSGWLDFTGRTMEQEAGNGWAEGVHADDLERCLQVYTGCFDKRIPFSMEYRLRRYDGEYRWILDNGAPRYSPGGDFLGYIGSCVDVHAQKTINQQLEDSVRQLNQINGELRMFNYLASNDLQEPLRKIETYSRLITDNFRENISPVTEAYLFKINEESKLMRKLISSLLEYTSIADAMHIREEVDLNQVLQHVAADFSKKLKIKNASLNIEKLPFVNGNYAQLHKVFTQLMDNSLKFSRPGVNPVITVTSAEIGNGKNVCGELKDMAYREICFADNGEGFDNKYRALVFDAFRKAQMINNSGSPGMGLSIVRKIVEMSQGFITAESELGKGAVFKIYFPSGARQ